MGSKVVGSWDLQSASTNEGEEWWGRRRHRDDSTVPPMRCSQKCSKVYWSTTMHALAVHRNIGRVASAGDSVVLGATCYALRSSYTIQCAEYGAVHYCSEIAFIILAVVSDTQTAGRGNTRLTPCCEVASTV